MRDTDDICMSLRKRWLRTRDEQRKKKKGKKAGRKVDIEKKIRIKLEKEDKRR